MPRYDRRLWRVAQIVRDQLQRRHENAVSAWAQSGTAPQLAIEQHHRLQRRLQRAMQRQMLGSVQRIRPQMLRNLNELVRTLESVHRHLAHPPPPVPAMRELLAEIEAIEDEFGELIVELEHAVIKVRTESIELEGLYLGPFEIQLFLHDLAQSDGHAAYAVVALDPRPAAGDDRVVHPHVSDDRLCTGEATTSINRALASGRLCDFFLLVTNVLKTYNPDSPYVPIDQWDGEPCHDCGYRMHEENRGLCEQCERDFCDECMGFCRHCETSICHGCMGTCDGCGEGVCDECVRRCEHCSDHFCPTCMTGALCAGCTEDLEQEEFDDDPQESHEEAVPQGGPPIPGASRFEAGVAVVRGTQHVGGGASGDHVPPHTP
ncbi:MAG: hypothetical protein WD534_15255 [Phycisphaeraceae bacterium]